MSPQNGKVPRVDLGFVNLAGKRFRVPPPFGDPVPPVLGREDLIQTMLCGLLDPSPMSIMLLGPPGTGKTHLAIDVARRLPGEGGVSGLPVYILQCTGSMHAEDVCVVARPVDGKGPQRIEYVLSPAAAAVAAGPAVLVLEEALKLPLKAWSHLLELTDWRKTLRSTLGGFALRSRGLRIIACANVVDAQIPDYIQERFPLKLTVPVPERSILDRIVETRYPENPSRDFLGLFWDQWKGALPSPRRLLDTALLAFKLAAQAGSRLSADQVRRALHAIP